MTSGDGCDQNCTPTACGNGITTDGEDCDTSGESPSCDADCTISGCGDGTFNVSAGEQCDTGGYSATCDADCTPVSCGDGVANVVAGETCDDGANNGDGDGFCLADCSAVQVCGDNVTNGTEACDDGLNNGAGSGFCLADWQEHREEGIVNLTDCVSCHKSSNEHESGENHREKGRDKEDDDD